MTLNISRSLGASLALLALGGCGQADQALQANEANFAKALQAYLARRGDLCLNRGKWPVDVSREEAAQGSRNSVQLPVLERLGLVASQVVEVDAEREGEPKTRTQARRYQLTADGRHYYRPREPSLHATDRPWADHDFCAARLSLKRVVAWDPPRGTALGSETTVTYTYEVMPAPWAVDAQARRVFPMVDHVLRGAGVAQLKEAMVLTRSGWEAKDL